MKISQLIHWLKRIYTTEETEISCSECFDLLSSYVERERSGESLENRMVMVKQHLFQCRVCQEEYELLRELADQEDE